MAPSDNFIQRAVNNGVATAGDYAGGVVDAAGKSVSSTGQNVGSRQVLTTMLCDLLAMRLLTIAV